MSHSFFEVWVNSFLFYRYVPADLINSLLYLYNPLNYFSSSRKYRVKLFSNCCDFFSLYIWKCLKNCNGRKKDCPRKQLIKKIFKNHCLDLDVTSNLKTGYFRDVSFDLNDGIWKLYKKLTNRSINVNLKSDQLSTFTKHFYKSIALKLETNSSNINIFNKTGIWNSHKKNGRFTPNWITNKTVTVMIIKNKKHNMVGRPPL